MTPPLFFKQWAEQLCRYCCWGQSWASTMETGHAKNVVTFEDLISFCTGYGATYNPSKANLKLASLTPQLTAALAALQSVKTAKTAYDNATNAREISFTPLKPLATKIINALAATDAASQTIDDARAIINKIQGRRAKAVEVPDAKALAAGAHANKQIDIKTICRQYLEQTDR